MSASPKRVVIDLTISEDDSGAFGDETSCGLPTTEALEAAGEATHIDLTLLQDAPLASSSYAPTCRKRPRDDAPAHALFDPSAIGPGLLPSQGPATWMQVRIFPAASTHIHNIAPQQPTTLRGATPRVTTAHRDRTVHERTITPADQPPPKKRPPPPQPPSVAERPPSCTPDPPCRMDVHACMQAPADLEESDPPAGMLTVSLMRHQRLALHWLLRQEGALPGATLPLRLAGGMLCDDQGLGKTIEMLALIVSNREPQPDVASWRAAVPAVPCGDVCPDVSELPQGGTLVVCPTSVMAQWSEEIRGKVAPEAGLDMLTYHSKGACVCAVRIKTVDGGTWFCRSHHGSGQTGKVWHRVDHVQHPGAGGASSDARAGYGTACVMMVNNASQVAWMCWTACLTRSTASTTGAAPCSTCAGIGWCWTRPRA